MAANVDDKSSRFRPVPYKNSLGKGNAHSD
jgi:hypothetical protein